MLHEVFEEQKRFIYPRWCCQVRAYKRHYFRAELEIFHAHQIQEFLLEYDKTCLSERTFGNQILKELGYSEIQELEGILGSQEKVTSKSHKIQSHSRKAKK